MFDERDEDITSSVRFLLKQCLDWFGFRPETVSINIKAGAMALEADDFIDGFVFDEDVRLEDLSEDDLVLRAKCRRDWTAPEFEEIIRRADIDFDDFDPYDFLDMEEVIKMACDKLGISVYFNPTVDTKEW